MTAFLRKLFGLAKPYWLRLAFGVAFGILAGLVEPLMVVLIPLVGGVVFPGSSPQGLNDYLQKAPHFLRSVGGGVFDFIGASSHATAARLLVISLVPSVTSMSIASNGSRFGPSPTCGQDCSAIFKTFRSPFLAAPTPGI